MKDNTSQNVWTSNRPQNQNSLNWFVDSPFAQIDMSKRITTKSLTTTTGDNSAIFDLEHIARLAKYKSAISNFVHILTGNMNIRVRYALANDSQNTTNGYGGFTDGETVSITANISDKNLDVVVGIALHEASHIVYTNFMQYKQGIYNIVDSIPEKYRVQLNESKFMGNTREFVGNVLNIIEDRYIDAMTYQSAPGYRQYYSAVYQELFDNKESNEIFDHIVNNPTRSLDQYVQLLIGIHNPKCPLDVLPRMRDIYHTIDLPNITRLSSQSDRINLAKNVCNIILYTRNIQSSYIDNTLPSKLEKHVDKQFDMINGTVKKSKLSKAINKTIDAFGDSGVKIDTVSDDVFSIIKEESYNKTRWDSIKYSPNVFFVKSPSKSFFDTELACLLGVSRYKNTYYTGIVESGVSAGKRLADSIKFRDEEHILDVTRLKSGRIDNRMLYNLGIDNYDVFKKTTISTPEDIFIHLTIDSSASMGSQWWNVLKMMSVVCTMSTLLKNVHLVASVRSTIQNKKNSFKSGGGDVTAFLMNVFDSKKHDTQYILDIFPRLIPCGATPEGYVYKNIRNEFQELPQNMKKYFINISDGLPTPRGLSKTTAEEISRMKSSGVNVLSYFIKTDDYVRYATGLSTDDTNTKLAFEQMYGRESTEILKANDLNHITKTINSLLLE